MAIFSDEIQNLLKEFEEMKVALREKTELLKQAEESEKQKSDELKKAIEQVGQFASVADQERNTYFLLLSSIGEGVFVLDLERKISIINNAGEKILEYSASEIIGHRFDELLQFIHKDKTPLEAKFWDDAFNSKILKALPPDISVIGKNGKAVPITTIVAPIIDDRTQELKGLIVTFRDVREERALEEARLGFISTSSHQLRTPLTSMRWFSEMLLDGDAGKLTDEQQKFVDRIYKGTDRMIALVNLLLQLARVEAGRLKIKPVPVDLKVITEGVALTLKANFEIKSQKVEIRTKPFPLPAVPMDQEIIWQIIQNLLSNASRYAHEKTTILVNIERKDSYIEYAVKNWGIGVPEDQKPRIFEKFFRADNALSSVPEGSGLGLSLVKNLVEGWGGKIWFESEVNKETTFYFTIPLSGVEAKEGEVGIKV